MNRCTWTNCNLPATDVLIVASSRWGRSKDLASAQRLPYCAGHIDPAEASTRRELPPHIGVGRAKAPAGCFCSLMDAPRGCLSCTCPDCGSVGRYGVSLVHAPGCGS